MKSYHFAALATKTLTRILPTLLLLLFVSGAHAQVGFAYLTGINIGGSSHRLPSGTLCYLAVDNNNRPLFNASTLDGQALASPTCATVTNGALPTNFYVPNTRVTNPINVCLRITVTDSNQNGKVIYAAPCVQPADTTDQASWCGMVSTDLICNFDHYKASLPIQALVQSGPQGVPGIGADASCHSDGSGHLTCSTVAAGTVSAGNLAPTPQNFGAKGDGTTNDAVALQDWLNAGAGGKLSCVNATYITNTQLTLPASGVTIDGPCTIKAGAAITSVFYAANGSSQAAWLYLDGIDLEGNSLAQYDFYAPYGIIHSQIRKNSYFRGSTTAAIYVPGPSYDFDILDSEISYNTLDGIDIVSTSYNNANNIERNKIFGNGGWGLNLQFASSILITGNTFESNTYGALYVNAYGRSILVHGNYFEGDGLTGYTFNLTGGGTLLVKAEIVLNGSAVPTTLNRAYLLQNIRIGSNFFNIYSGGQTAVFLEAANLQFDNNIESTSGIRTPAIISYSETGYGSAFSYPLVAFSNQNFLSMLQWSPGNIAGPTVTTTAPGNVSATSLTITKLTVGQPSGSPASTGGTVSDSAYNYARIVALDAGGNSTLPGTISAAVTTSGGNLSTIPWIWTAVAGAVGYRIWVCNTPSCTPGNYFSSIANSFTQTLPASSGLSGTMPVADTTGQFVAQGLTGILYANDTDPVTASATGTAANQVVLGGVVTAGSVGSAMAIPVITYNAAGQITGVTTATPPSGHSPAMRGGCGGSYGSAGTYYIPSLGAISGTACSTSTISYGSGLVATSSGTLSNLSVRCLAAGTASFTIFDAPSGTGAPGTTTGITLDYSTAGGTNQVVQDATHTASYAAGDLITIQVVVTTTTLGNCVASFNY